MKPPEIQMDFDEFVDNLSKCQELRAKDDQDTEDDYDYEEYSDRAIEALRRLVVRLMRDTLGNV